MIVYRSGSSRSALSNLLRSGSVSQTTRRLYVTKPVWAANKNATSSSASKASSKPNESSEFPTTSSNELHPLPSSVKSAGKPSAPSDVDRYAASGNSLSPADLSSRPSGPGPSSPQVNAERAAPRFAGSSNGNGNGSSNGNGYNGDDLTFSSTSIEGTHDWATSFSGMSTAPFPKEVSQILEEPIDEGNIEIKPDGLLYLPEIKYRRILNRAFGPGGWGLAPRSETNVSDKIVSREWALICLGRFVSTARGEQEYFDAAGVATATEGAKSNALMRCCKDLGIAHELWSPRFIRSFKEKKCIEVFVENASTGKKRKLWRRKDGPPFEYPWKELK